CERTALGGEAAQRPRIPLVAGDPNARLGDRRRAVETDAARPALPHGGLGEPENLLVCGWPAGFRMLVRPLDDLEVTALLPRALQHPHTAWRFGLTRRLPLVVVSLVFDSVFVDQAPSER